MKRPMPQLAQIWLGTNFWSRTGGPLMWRNYDPTLVREELQGLRDHGLNMTRSFFYWPDFQPEPDVIDEEKCSHYADFLDAHQELGMTTIPTFIVGHMSGENWDPSWRHGRSIYSDVWMVERQAWYIERLTRRFAEHPAVCGWLISNEIPIYGMEDDVDTVTAWARLMVHAVRAGGGHQPVSIGDGAWGLEVTGHDSGFSVRRLAEFTDFVGPHVYKMETDVVRQHLKAAFICELAAIGELPVVMEEFGLSTDFVSTENSGHYYRQLLNNTLLAGSVGWMSWNNTDYDQIIDQRPYSHHPFELHFGITDHQGQPKRPLLELRDFGQRLASMDLANCHRVDAEAALIVSSYLAEDYSFHDEAQRSTVAKNSEQGYVAAKEAGLPVGVIREAADGGLPEGYRLYIAPSVKELAGPTWIQLRELARSGATVYASYCAGESPFQRGPWWTDPDRLFGVRNDLVYGINNRVEDDVVEVSFSEDFGTIKAGEVLKFAAGGNEHSRAFLPVVVTDGRVIAQDQHGRAVLVTKDHGPGRAVLSTIPVEHFAACRRGANPEDTWRLYDALRELAGIAVPVRVGDPRVLVDGMEHRDGRQFWFLSSQSDQPLSVEMDADGELQDAHGNTTQSVTLDPWAVEVFTLNPHVEH